MLRLRRRLNREMTQMIVMTAILAVILTAEMMKLQLRALPSLLPRRVMPQKASPLPASLPLLELLRATALL